MATRSNAEYEVTVVLKDGDEHERTESMRFSAVSADEAWEKACHWVWEQDDAELTIREVHVDYAKEIA